MTAEELQHFAQLIRQEAGAMLNTWRKEVAKLPGARQLSVPVLNDHIPALIEELAVAFETRSDASIVDAITEGTPVAHGAQRLVDGFDIVEVVAEYNILRGCLHELALTHGLNMSGKAFHILNLVLDGAIGQAVASYATLQALQVQQRREEYLAFVAHDLRTPLNAISLATNILEETMTPADNTGDAAKMISVLHRNVDQLQAMVHKVLEENTNLKTEVGVKLELRHFDLWPVVERLIHDLKPVGGSGSTVLINQVPSDLAVYGDAGHIRSVLQNLLGNAITYTPRGTITIGAKARDEEGLVECWVSDTGKGIPPHRLGQVFQKGEGDDEREESSGLGLAIVKVLIEAHRGSIHAESDEGKGSTFRFTLPLKER